MSPRADILPLPGRAALVDPKTRGYTLIELMLSVVVGVAVLAGAYASYGIVANQYDKISTYAEIQERGLSTLRFLARDLRMAGHKELDGQLESAWGRIDDGATMTDSGVACCDTLTVIYDRDLFTRHRVTYHVDERSSPTRDALFMDIETWDGSTWNMATQNALVVDYVEDFQVEYSDNNSDGDPQLADIVLLLRSRNAFEQVFSYTTPSYNPGNSNFSASDNYYRQAFTTTVNLRNLRN